MSVETIGAVAQYIDFGNILSGISHKLFLMWIDRYTDVRGTLFGKTENGSFTSGWAASVEDSGGGAMRLFFRNYFTTSYGLWRNNSNLGTGLQHIAIDYDWGSTSNDPRIWINGVAQGITELTTPSGSNKEGSGNNFYLADIDGSVAGFASIYGNYIGFTVHDVSSLTTGEIDAIVANAYGSRKFIPTLNNIAFAPNLNGPAGGLVDGAAMSAGNTIRDLISGTAGVPAGSPVFKNNTVLSLGGE